MSTVLQRQHCVLVGVQLPGVTDGEHTASLTELERLAQTLGARVVGSVTQRRDALAHAAVLGSGKLLELGRLTGGTGIVPSGAPKRKGKRDFDEEEAEPAGGGPPSEDATRATLVVVDHDVTPSQARNLERATGARVLDRTAVILEIFHRHARSREARLQVEIARLSYLAPRMRDSGVRHDRQRGGIGGKGAGESAMELDRRKVRDRIAELRRELDALDRTHRVRRARRQEELRVALVGYTNAGKSSWMRALTGSDVLVADKLFATLDTTVRALQPESHPRVLMSDTVGFIKKLPHDLVASFRSTLDEAVEASLIVHVADGSDPALETQLATTRKVLGEIGAGDVPSLLVLNKADRFDAVLRDQLALEHPDALLLSAYGAGDVSRLRSAILDHFERDMIDAELFLPYAKQTLLGEIHARARVVSEEYGDSGVLFRVRTHPDALAKLRTLV
ncbi:MAG: GTPase HflX [Deltaproteobacteria bacterium]|nr:GTPase HflX [Deltaproteobacteria bacterium]